MTTPGDNRNVKVTLTANTDGYQKALSGAAKATDGLVGSVTKLAKGIDDLIKRTGRSMIAGGGAGLLGMAGSVEAAQRLQKAFDGVRSTSVLTGQSVKELQANALDLSRSLPIATTSVAQLMGQVQSLGVEGTANITKFTEVAIRLAAATQTAPGQLLSGIVQLTRTMGQSYQNVENYSSALVSLSKSNGVAAQSILDFSNSIEAVAQRAGFTETQVMGLATAFQRVGADGFAAANAFNTVINQISDAVSTGSPVLNEYAHIVGQTTEQFANLAKSNPAQAFIEVVQGIEREGPKAIQTLQQLGLDSTRTMRVFAALTSGQANLSQALGQASDAYSKNDALVKSSNASWNDLSSSMTKFRTAVAQVAESLGGPLLTPVTKLVDLVTSLINTFNKLPGPIKDIIGVFATLGSSALVILGSLTLVTLALFKFQAVLRVVNGVTGRTIFDGIRDGMKGMPRDISQIDGMSRSMQRLYNTTYRGGAAYRGTGAPQDMSWPGLLRRRFQLEVRESKDTLAHPFNPYARDPAATNPLSMQSLVQRSSGSIARAEEALASGRFGAVGKNFGTWAQQRRATVSSRALDFNQVELQARQVGRQAEEAAGKALRSLGPDDINLLYAQRESLRARKRSPLKAEGVANLLGLSEGPPPDPVKAEAAYNKWAANISHQDRKRYIAQRSALVGDAAYQAHKAELQGKSQDAEATQATSPFARASQKMEDVVKGSTERVKTYYQTMTERVKTVLGETLQTTGSFATKTFDIITRAFAASVAKIGQLAAVAKEAMSATTASGAAAAVSKIGPIQRAGDIAAQAERDLRTSVTSAAMPTHGAPPPPLWMTRAPSYPPPPTYPPPIPPAPLTPPPLWMTNPPNTPPPPGGPPGPQKYPWWRKFWGGRPGPGYDIPGAAAAEVRAGAALDAAGPTRWNRMTAAIGRGWERYDDVVARGGTAMRGYISTAGDYGRQGARMLPGPIGGIARLGVATTELGAKATVTVGEGLLRGLGPVTKAVGSFGSSLSGLMGGPWGMFVTSIPFIWMGLRSLGQHSKDAGLAVQGMAQQVTAATGGQYQPHALGSGTSQNPADAPQPFGDQETNKARSADWVKTHQDTLNYLNKFSDPRDKPQLIQNLATQMIMGTNNGAPLTAAQQQDVREIMISTMGVQGARDAMGGINFGYGNGQTAGQAQLPTGAAEAQGLFTQTHRINVLAGKDAGKWGMGFAGGYSGDRAQAMLNQYVMGIMSYGEDPARQALGVLGGAKGFGNITANGVIGAAHDSGFQAFAKVYQDRLKQQGIDVQGLGDTDNLKDFITKLQGTGSSKNIGDELLQALGGNINTLHDLDAAQKILISNIDKENASRLGSSNVYKAQQTRAGRAAAGIAGFDPDTTGAATFQRDMTSWVNSLMGVIGGKSGGASASRGQTLVGTLTGNTNAIDALQEWLRAKNDPLSQGSQAVSQQIQTLFGQQQGYVGQYMTPIQGAQFNLGQAAKLDQADPNNTTLRNQYIQTAINERDQMVQQLRQYDIQVRDMHRQERYSEEDHTTQLTHMYRDRKVQTDEALYQRNQSLKQANHDWTEQLRSMRYETAQSWNPLQAVNSQWSVSAGQGLISAQRQNAMLQATQTGLSQLQNMGVSSDVVRMLGLDSPQNSQQLTKFVKDLAQNPALVTAWNDNIKNRLKISDAIDTSANNSKFIDMKRSFDYTASQATLAFNHSMQQSDLAYQTTLADFEQAYTVQVTRMGDEMALIGENTFWSATEVVNKAKESGVGALQDYATQIDTVTGQINTAVLGTQQTIQQVLTGIEQWFHNWLANSPLGILFGMQSNNSVPAPPPANASPGQTLDNLLQLPGRAAGGVVTSAHHAVVGESGPELILPLNNRGAQFIANVVRSVDVKGARTAGFQSQMVINGSFTTHWDSSTQFHGPITVQAQDPNQMARQLAAKKRLERLRQPATARSA